MDRTESLTVQQALKQQGYLSRFESANGGVVVVRDPVQSSRNGREFKDVTLRSVNAMHHFISARS